MVNVHYLFLSVAYLAVITVALKNVLSPLSVFVTQSLFRIYPDSVVFVPMNYDAMVIVDN